MSFLKLQIRGLHLPLVDEHGLLDGEYADDTLYELNWHDIGEYADNTAL